MLIPAVHFSSVYINLSPRRSAATRDQSDAPSTKSGLSAHHPGDGVAAASSYQHSDPAGTHTHIDVTAHSFSQGGTPLEHCVFDETSYMNGSCSH